MADPEDLITDETKAEEDREAGAAHDAGQMPTPEEEAAAKKNVPVDAKVKDAYKEQVERGAKVQGEGQIVSMLEGGETRTLQQVLDAFEADGYALQLIPHEGGSVRVAASGDEVAATDLQVDQFARLEGTSDPDDMTIVAAVRLPQGDRKATLVLAYGPEASGADADVLRDLDLR